jgi:hemerythrin-like domain-containing protein
VGNDLLRIHRVITRGLEIGIQHTQKLLELESAADQGFVDYLIALISTLDSHHQTEDEVAFPYLRQKNLSAPYDILAAEHIEMLKVLKTLQQMLPNLAIQGAQSKPLADANLALKKILEIWRVHIRREEESFSPAVAAQLLTEEDQAALSMSMGQFAQQHSSPDYLVIPFILYNLTPQDRAVMINAMPPVITQELLPGPWKEKWGPMQPYLLE